MDPKFAILNVLSFEDFDLETECCITKMKWNRMSGSDGDEDEEEREENEIEEAESREVYNPIMKTFDMQKQRVTDLDHNAYVILPKPQSVDYEAQLEMRRQKYRETFNEYREQNCNKEGQQKSNLTKQEARGIKKLKSWSNDSILILPILTNVKSIEFRIG